MRGRGTGLRHFGTGRSLSTMSRVSREDGGECQGCRQKTREVWYPQGQKKPGLNEGVIAQQC